MGRHSDDGSDGWRRITFSSAYIRDGSVLNGCVRWQWRDGSRDMYGVAREGGTSLIHIRRRGSLEPSRTTLRGHGCVLDGDSGGATVLRPPCWRLRCDGSTCVDTARLSRHAQTLERCGSWTLSRSRMVVIAAVGTLGAEMSECDWLDKHDLESSAAST